MDYYIPQHELTPPAIEWRIEGARSVPANDLHPLLMADAQSSGEAVVREYKSRGVLAVRVRIEGSHYQRVLFISEGHIRAKGTYARYLPDSELLTQDALDTAIARAQAEARANNDTLLVQIGRVDDNGLVDVVLEGKALDASSRNVVVSATSFGPRYSGADVVTLSSYALLDNGMTADAAATVSLADLRQDSKGGHYTGVSAGISKAGTFGLFSLRASYSNFKVGGVNLPLDQRGQISKMDGEWSYRLTPNITPFAGLVHTRQTAEIRAADWSDTVNSTAAKAGVRVQKNIPMQHGLAVLRGDITLEHGISASRSLNAPSPLLGALDEHYRAVAANADISVPLTDKGARLDLAFGAQRASDGAPSGAQFYAGGPKRGVSYHAGVYAGPSGAYASMQLTSAPMAHKVAGMGALRDLRAYIGVDGARVKTASGVSLSTTSAQIGLHAKVGQSSRISLGYASPIDGPATAKGRFTFFFMKSF